MPGLKTNSREFINYREAFKRAGYGFALGEMDMISNDIGASTKLGASSA